MSHWPTRKTAARLASQRSGVTLFLSSLASLFWVSPMKSRLLLILLLSVLPRLASADDQKPNILFIAIDDQNDWIGCLNGHPQIKTPNIDGLAAKGTVFLNAHCQSPLCNSSRTSLMTGRRPSSTGVYGLAPWFRDVKELKDIVSLPQHLRKHGYQALSTGKIYHGGSGRRPKDDEFDVLGPASGIGVKPPKKLVETPSPHPLVDWGVFPHEDEDKGDFKVASWGVEQLQKKHDQPFFLSVGFFLPHVPCYATQKWFDLYPEDTLQLPPFAANDRDDTPRFSWYMHWKLPEPRHKFLVEANQWKNLVRSYLACTSFVDSQVGRVLEALHNSDAADNTIVVLWSDHGWHLGEKLITGKNSLWDRSTRVPLIFAGPGISAGGRCEQPAELLDIYPTLSDLCGLPNPDGLEGHSLLPQLKNAAAEREWPAITTHNHDNHGVRSKTWRYIQYADHSEELYNMQDDPNEWKNLASDAQYTSVIAEHRKWIPKSVQPAPGSKHRILLHRADGTVNWEGEEVSADDPIPELD
jgi:choline-sulfatase